MEQVNSTGIKVISFSLQDEEYAIPVKQVGSIERMQQITRVPNTVSYIKGVINLSGVVTPIIDLRKRFGLQEKAYDDSTRIIIVYYKELELGIIVDSARDVIDIYEEDIEPTPEVIGSVDVDYIDGVTKVGNRLLILPDLEKVLEQSEKDMKVSEGK
ncbi:MAG TPA: chemotaxis protein CheW [Candidatus Avamphibacillus intestinigallinarum]|nr:chemotaxis protein CheW [Candidatus Avamphibacillus intestinigallinarum]